MAYRGNDGNEAMAMGPLRPYVSSPFTLKKHLSRPTTRAISTGFQSHATDFPVENVSIAFTATWLRANCP